MPASLLAENLKTQSEDFLRDASINVNPNLPVLDDWSPRDATEVAQRALALHGLVAVGQGAPAGLVLGWLTKNQLESSLTPNERAALSDRSPPAPLVRDGFLWGAESAFALAWALGWSSDFGFDRFAPDVLTVNPWPDLSKGQSVGQRLLQLQLRPQNEISQALDLAFRLHWAVNDAAFMGTPFPSDRFHPEVIVERRRALVWLSSPGIAWDAVDLSV